MKGDWLVGMDFRCWQPLIITENCSAEVFNQAHVFSASLVDSQDIADKQDSLTVMRTVGEINVAAGYILDGGTGGFSGIMTLWLCEGIYVAGSDGTLPAAQTIELDPRNPGDLELDTWLWMRRRCFPLDYNTPPGAKTVKWIGPNDYQNALGPHLDLRVKRRLERGQELVYVAAVYNEAFLGQALENVPFDAIDLAIQANLRCYVKF